MNKRQKKKRIPKNTDFCYQIIGRESDGVLKIKKCPFYKIIGYVDDAIIDATGKEHPCKSPIAYCSYAKVSSEEDVLLLEKIKTCDERLPKYHDY